jgi:hypothetical protein
MRLMRLEAEYQKKRTNKIIQNHKKYPYLLRNLAITHPNQLVYGYNINSDEKRFYVSRCYHGPTFTLYFILVNFKYFRK